MTTGGGSNLPRATIALAGVAQPAGSAGSYPRPMAGRSRVTVANHP